MKQTSVRERRKFDETFKREAVQNWLNSGKSAGVVGEELGITASLLYSWRNMVPAAAGGGRRRPRPVRWLICKANWMLLSGRTVICGSNARF